MGEMKGFALRAAGGTISACLFVMAWARQISVLFFLVWLLALVLPGACTAIAMWAVSRRRMPSVTVRFLLGMAIGMLGIYVEAFMFSVFRPDLPFDSVAPSNIVPGMVIGVFVTYFVVGFNPAPRKKGQA